MSENLINNHGKDHPYAAGNEIETLNHKSTSQLLVATCEAAARKAADRTKSPINDPRNPSNLKSPAKTPTTKIPAKSPAGKAVTPTKRSTVQNPAGTKSQICCTAQWYSGWQ